MIQNKEKIDKCDKRVKELVAWLEQVYKTIIITSGARSEVIDGHSKSMHLMENGACAVDVVVPKYNAIQVAAKVLDNIGKFAVRGIGINPYAAYNYCHFDFRPSGEVVYWTYDKNNRTA